jgi:hypothetical protein
MALQQALSELRSIVKILIGKESVDLTVLKSASTAARYGT